MCPAVHTAIIGAVLGYVFGHWLGNLITSGYPQAATGGGSSDTNDTPVVLGYLFMVIGWLIGLGFFNDLFNQMRGKRLLDYRAAQRRRYRARAVLQVHP